MGRLRHLTSTGCVTINNRNWPGSKRATGNWKEATPLRKRRRRARWLCFLSGVSCCWWLSSVSTVWRSAVLWPVPTCCRTGAPARNRPLDGTRTTLLLGSASKTTALANDWCFAPWNWLSSCHFTAVYDEFNSCKRRIPYTISLAYYDDFYVWLGSWYIPNSFLWLELMLQSIWRLRFE